MSFLIEGEKVIKRFGQSRITQAKLYFAAVALFLIPVIYNLYFSKVKLPIPGIYVIAIPAAIGFILILIAEFKTRLGSYYITNYRVISIRGAMKKTMDSCTYDKMVNVKIMQTFLQRILGMGTIDITTYQKTEILLNSISNPTNIEKLIYSAMERQSQQQAAGGRSFQQPQYQPKTVPAPAQQSYEPQLEPNRPAKREEEGQPYEERQMQNTRQLRPFPLQQSGYKPRNQNRPLLASERRAVDQPELAQQPVYRQMLGQQESESQAQKKKRFGLF